MTVSTLAVFLLGPMLALGLLVLLVGGMVVASRRDTSEEEVRTPGLGGAFLLGSLAGGMLLGLGNALAAVVVGARVAECAAAGVVAGLLVTPLLLGSLLAGHASIVAITVAVLANAGAVYAALSWG